MSEKRIKGTIVHLCRDRYGEIIVADDCGLRSLYFGDGVLQSCIRLDRPETLIMDYSQAMMSTLIFKNRPEAVLLIGLGGCSLVNFLLRALPECSLDVVEIRKQVIDVAHGFFLLPGHNGKLKIVHAAGQDFVGEQEENCSNYDLILVDAFDDDGPAAALLEKPFLTTCRSRLKEDGIFAINVWNRPKDNFPVLYAAVKEVFGNNTLKLLLSEAYRNAIIFGFDKPALFHDLPAHRPIAKRLQRLYQINFPKYLKHLYWQNFS